MNTRKLVWRGLHGGRRGENAWGLSLLLCGTAERRGRDSRGEAPRACVCTVWASCWLGACLSADDRHSRRADDRRSTRSFAPPFTSLLLPSVQILRTARVKRISIRFIQEQEEQPSTTGKPCPPKIENTVAARRGYRPWRTNQILRARCQSPSPWVSGQTSFPWSRQCLAFDGPRPLLCGGMRRRHLRRRA